MPVMPFAARLTEGVADGLVAVALVDREGVTVSHVGAIAEEEAMPLAAYVMHRLASPDLRARLFTGEILTLAMEDRVVAVGVAGRQLFVVAVLGDWTPATQAIVRELRDDIDEMLSDTRAGIDVEAPPTARGGGSTSGPAELPLIEFGITVRRGKA